eukprot:539505_1
MLKSNVRKRKDILPLSPRSSASSQSRRRQPDPLWKNTKFIAIIECIVIIILVSTVMYYRWTITQSQTNTQRLYHQYTEQQNELNHLREKDRESRRDGSEGDDLKTGHSKDKDAWDETDKQWINDLQNNDYKALKLRYGNEDNIRVLIETNYGNIVLEMAPIRSMPHTVRYFLDLVETKFWNGCHFFRNAHHVIQANCHKRNTDNENSIPAGQSGSIVFQEYDEDLEYLHKPYSIGLAGRPGGPDFYVNLVDNKRNHGPGGQGPKPDPCFAYITDGKDVIDKVKEMEHDGSAMMVLKDWVEFKNVYVMTK